MPVFPVISCYSRFTLYSRLFLLFPVIPEVEKERTGRIQGTVPFSGCGEKRVTTLRRVASLRRREAWRPCRYPIFVLFSRAGTRARTRACIRFLTLLSLGAAQRPLTHGFLLV